MHCKLKVFSLIVGDQFWSSSVTFDVPSLVSLNWKPKVFTKDRAELSVLHAACFYRNSTWMGEASEAVLCHLRLAAT